MPSALVRIPAALFAPAEKFHNTLTPVPLVFSMNTVPLFPAPPTASRPIHYAARQGQARIGIRSVKPVGKVVNVSKTGSIRIDLEHGAIISIATFRRGPIQHAVLPLRNRSIGNLCGQNEL